MEDIILVGGGGHCRSVIDSITSNNEFHINGIVDTKENVGLNVQGFKIIGTDDELLEFKKRGVNYAFITLGSIGNSKRRENLYNYCQEIGFIIPSIIDKTSIQAKNIVLGDGTYIGKGAIINTNTTIGNNSIINSGSILEHDCTIGEHVHISPGVVIGGTVQIGNNTHVGIGSTVIQDVKIGEYAFIGASSNVVKNVNSFTTVYGNPAREKKK